MRRAVVLAIDDDLEMAGLMEMVLETAGFIVETAPSVFEGMKTIARIQPDVVLLDIMMPGVNGWQLCEALRENASTAAIPVVFVTALGGAHDRETAEKAGAAGYITKPFSNDGLVAEVRRHLPR
ncbi:MAG: response regulator [Clostridiales bacterium]|nr:response regulator [Clostridiales bacterium]